MTPIERPIQSESVKFKVGLKLDSWHCSQSTEDFDKSTKLYRASQKVSPLTFCNNCKSAPILIKFYAHKTTSVTNITTYS